MTALFNPDMDRRLSDLWRALLAGEGFTAKFEPKFAGQPDRVAIRTGNRVLIFPIPTAQALAAQLALNGQDEAAADIEAACG